ncbi:hypothetical protein [Propionispora hippei]|uniref:Fibronectin type-III domain-containing protein n=1 Tax=Propionispora hippei DSM 15287 TaxID=1123003 RepID=A0A1M6CYN2_9FIRM|nr:hypothetical protein [Propionispora hippei]SHI66096.1 hypothetical protein SAMN02745170_00786 [Propionispora hippei DSM 15287]
MATVGQQLTAPETGWKRYDDTDSNITCEGGSQGSKGACYNGTFHEGPMVVRFCIKDTTRLRYIGCIGVSTLYTTKGIVKIDGVQVASFIQIAGDKNQVINAEITGMTQSIHHVEISCSDGKWIQIDAIDIDENGVLLPYDTISVPTNLLATAGNSQMTLSWTAVANASGYNVKRSTTADGPYTTIASNVATNNYTDTTATNGTTYYYVVTALGGTSESVNSNEVSATPGAPENALLRVTVIDSSDHDYQLSLSEINSFINWFMNHTNSDTAGYMLNKKVGTQVNKEYLAFDKIISFEVIPLPAG